MDGRTAGQTRRIVLLLTQLSLSLSFDLLCNWAEVRKMKQGVADEEQQIWIPARWKADQKRLWHKLKKEKQKKEMPNWPWRP